ncbi:phage tail tip lysozyme [Methylorubrum populi]|uniref:Phage tail lysozyme domain-containing protein n=1 Tax=Methylorubrum populi TaxID=223967 RepID=A0A833JAJ9_9HYPH|nr:phage tail tip lysozyme [Methylorubrum populi]KAB7788044.1 hypothetical protein F8B43_0049 [Methylorubrum populi]
MADDVLKSFVVSLGWKVDREGERRVTEALGSVTKQAALLATALGAAALAATAAVAKIAAQFDNLYFVSQRTGATVQNIKGLAYAFGQVGGSGAGAVSAIESFSRSMRTNPGIRQFVRDLGVATEAGGKTRDSVDVLTDAIDAIQKKHPYYVGAQMASLLGIDEQTFNTLSTYRKEIKEFRAEYERTARTVGLNNDAAAAASNKFMTALRGLQAAAQAVAEKILTDLSPVLTKFLEDIRTWIEKNPETITKAIEAIIAAAIALVTAFRDIATALTPVAQGFQSMAEHMTGKEGLQAAMEAFAVFLVGSWLVRILGAFGKVRLGWVALLAGIGMDVYKNSTPEGRAETIRQGEEALNREQGAERGGFIGGLREKFGSLRKNLPTWLGGTGGAAGADAGADAGPSKPLGKISRNENAQTIIRTLREAGYSDNAIAAVVGSMQTESTFNPRARNEIAGGHTGLWQWDKNRWPRVKKWITDRGGDPYSAEWQTKAWIAEHDAKPGDPMYDHRRTERGGKILRGDPTIEEAIHGVRESERFGPGEEGGRAANARKWLPHVKAPSPAPAPTIPKMDIKPGISAQQFNERFGSAPPMGAMTSNTSSTNVTMNHNTQIRVDGTGDPATVANRVERGQTRINDLSLRNAQTAIR